MNIGPYVERALKNLGYANRVRHDSLTVEYRDGFDSWNQSVIFFQEDSRSPRYVQLQDHQRLLSEVYKHDEINEFFDDVFDYDLSKLEG